jgi:hypothetical protein
VAHEAAQWILAADFAQWELSTKSGWTVAHEAAKQGILPADFAQWELAEKRNIL